MSRAKILFYAVLVAGVAAFIVGRRPDDLMHANLSTQEDADTAQVLADQAPPPPTKAITPEQRLSDASEQPPTPTSPSVPMAADPEPEEENEEDLPPEEKLAQEKKAEKEKALDKSKLATELHRIYTDTVMVKGHGYRYGLVIDVQNKFFVSKRCEPGPRDKLLPTVYKLEDYVVMDGERYLLARIPDSKASSMEGWAFRIPVGALVNHRGGTLRVVQISKDLVERRRGRARFYNLTDPNEWDRKGPWNCDWSSLFQAAKP